jgi:hypothetical protein
VDLHGYLRRPPNARVAVEFARDAFWNHVIEAIDRLGAAAAAGAPPDVSAR